MERVHKIFLIFFLIAHSSINCPLVILIIQLNQGL